MKVMCINRAIELGNSWDELADSVYQKRNFLHHLEETNASGQKYYCLFQGERIIAGAVVYSLKVNLLTFSEMEFKVPMQIIGLPISCSDGGLLGQDKYAAILLNHIFNQERGILLCLNYDQVLSPEEPIQMNSLPTMILDIKQDDWMGYLKNLRHPYRRRIRKALNKSQNVEHKSSSCHAFTKVHYQQYLEVMKRSNTKLETLELQFFENLPENFRLHSFYRGNQLLYWHIAVKDKNQYNFLFGGIEYTLRDQFDSYTNNLIAIIKEGIRLGVAYIDLGQTASESKARFGAISRPKSMFLYHRMPFVRKVFRLFKNQLGYNLPSAEHRVFKEVNLSIV